MEQEILKTSLQVWMQEEYNKLPRSPDGYVFGWVDPRNYPGFKIKETENEHRTSQALGSS